MSWRSTVKWRYLDKGNVVNSSELQIDDGEGNIAALTASEAEALYTFLRPYFNERPDVSAILFDGLKKGE